MAFPNPYIVQLFLLMFISAGVFANFNFTPFNADALMFCYYKGDVSSSASVVDLTENDINSKTVDSSGKVYYKTALLFKNSTTFASFSTYFSFQIIPVGYPADGMTFWVQQTPLYPAGGGSLGINGTTDNPFLAVEFDTYTNTEFNDPWNAHHVGIDLNNMTSVNTSSSNLNLNLTQGKFFAWINYDAQVKTLEVRLTNDSQQGRPSVPVVQADVDLFNFFNSSMLYVGLSAATGASGELHKVYSWSFNIAQIDVALPAAPSKSKKNILHVTLAAVFSCVIFAGALLTLFICIKQKSTKNPDAYIPESQFTEISLPRFTYSDLSTATKRFSQNEVLGKGGCGSVYKGVLPSDGSLVAVKVMSADGYHQFVAELSVIGRLRHKNLVGLRGWCYEQNKLILVYDYMSNGSLDQHLFSADVLLSWPQRYEIVKGIAEGLAFLHGGWEQRIVHRDIKAANVLLDSNYVARLGDFGLSKLMESNKTLQTMTQAGTRGYIAPELIYMGRASEKSDTYSFGILLLEIACGKSVFGITYESQEYEFLLDCVWQAQFKDELLAVADPRLNSDYDKDEMKVVLSLGLLCSNPDAELRLSMRRCCQILNSEATLPDLSNSRPTMFFGHFQPDSSSLFSQSTGSTGQSSGFSSNSNSEKCNLPLLHHAG